MSEQESVQVDISDELKAKIAAYDPDLLAANYQARRAQAQAFTMRLVILYEGVMSGPNRAITNDVRDLDDMDFNDAAESLTFYGPAGEIVTVFDSSSYRTNDDFMIIVKRNDNPVEVRNFERGLPGQWNYHPDYDWYRADTGNLNGKVSSIRFGQWYPDSS